MSGCRGRIARVRRATSTWWSKSRSREPRARAEHVAGFALFERVRDPARGAADGEDQDRAPGGQAEGVGD